MKIKELFLVYRTEGYYSSSTKLVGVVSSIEAMRELQKIDRERFPQGTQIEYSYREIYTDLGGING